MNIEQIKLAQFVDDAVMNSAVYEVLLNAFIRYEKGDVQFLAAKMIAINLLQDAWKDLQKYRNQVEKEKIEVTQVGL